MISYIINRPLGYCTSLIIYIKDIYFICLLSITNDAFSVTVLSVGRVHTQKSTSLSPITITWIWSVGRTRGFLCNNSITYERYPLSAWFLNYYLEVYVTDSLYILIFFYYLKMHFETNSIVVLQRLKITKLDIWFHLWKRFQNWPVPSSALVDELMRRPQNLKLKNFLENMTLCDLWRLLSVLFLWRWRSTDSVVLKFERYEHRDDISIVDGDQECVKC